MNKPGPSVTFVVQGLDCAEEVRLLKQAVAPLVGGEDQLSFNLLQGQMVVEGVAETDAAFCARICAAVHRTGLRATPLLPSAASEATVASPQSSPQPGPQSGPQSGNVDRWREVLTAVSGLCTLAAFLFQLYLSPDWQIALGETMAERLGDGLRQGPPGSGALPYSLPASPSFFALPPLPYSVLVLYAVAILAGLYLVLPKALQAMRRLRPDMNLLMTLAVAGAIFLQQWLEAATVAFLFALSLTLESRSIGRARQAIAKLLQLSATTVRVQLPTGAWQDCAPESVAAGSHFQVRPGERLGLDGEVVEGTSAVNQAPITGESLPVTKQPGDPVFAGTVNGTGTLLVRATKTAQQSTLAQIIRLVGEAQRRRAPAEQWVDRFAAVYTPAIVALAVAVLLFPTLLFGQPFAPWLYRALVLLVIACPCALVISTPVSVVSALAAAARQGILVKGGLHLETPARLRAIAFDKTGTLTTGKPTLVHVLAMPGHREEEVLQVAAALEAANSHPLAEAVMAHCAEKQLAFTPAADVTVLPGKGVVGRLVPAGQTVISHEAQPPVAPKACCPEIPCVAESPCVPEITSVPAPQAQLWLGSLRYFEERLSPAPDLLQELRAWANQQGHAHTLTAVGLGDTLYGVLAFADPLRPEAASALSALRQAGIAHFAILSGDNSATVNAIVQQCNGNAVQINNAVQIDEAHAELLPAEKEAAIGQLVAQHGCVAMVGDGINDAPALSRASLGIAMATAGNDIATEAADIALLSADLHRLPWLVQHSRRMVGIIRANIYLSLGVKALFVGLTLAGHASLWLAILADTGVSLLVIGNALRLLRAPKPAA